MQLYGVRIFVDDLAAAREFYGETLGLAAVWEMPDAVGYGAGGATLIVETEDPAGPDGELVGRFVGVSLAVEDIAAAHRDLAARGVVFHGAPTAQPWGGMLAHFDDPAGNTLTLLGKP
ncbi:hypothetical protein LNKW23_09950 [Paralimibaculum aggregatum]|uniref:VOC domain-containing protein n=1 Tax=Paralimibaculum aggregatum TaxID=3036245 RepID=A0ABQ6LEL1_9RHOB|nr:VOC family protein [Limibaculum sp. NKW23]GMG81782.1 hypothetical protein LNKW23_09950 [Limibaculum sp. NKW23]